jgi:hypothetical protein
MEFWIASKCPLPFDHQKLNCSGVQQSIRHQRVPVTVASVELGDGVAADV